MIAAVNWLPNVLPLSASAASRQTPRGLGVLGLRVRGLGRAPSLGGIRGILDFNGLAPSCRAFI